MGPRGRLLLLLLLLAGSSSQEEGAENHSASCPKDSTRFKHLRKYVYSYEAESANAVAGTSDSRSATKINCKVELEVPQPCSFVLRMSQCSLREVSGFSPEGRALLRKTKNSDTFSEALSRHELRLSIPDGKKVLLYPEKEEPVHILNIKRGVLSALLAPLETDEDAQELSLDTAHGSCPSLVTVQARKGTVATEMTVQRNLQRCDGFRPVSRAASPIALVRGLGGPLSSLLSSEQTCRYTLDPRRKHVAEAVCREQHLFLPSSSRTPSGMAAHVTQTLKLEDAPKINSRFFDAAASQETGLAVARSEEAPAAPAQDGEALLKTLRELQALPAAGPSEARAELFSRLVRGLRGLPEDGLEPLLPRLLDVSSPVALQALAQCGRPQCYAHILRWLRTEKVSPALLDAAAYVLALVAGPSGHALHELLRAAQERPNRVTLYALSHAVSRYHPQTPGAGQELRAVADYLMSRLGSECAAGSEQDVHLTLRVLGNMGGVLEAASPQLKASILRCVQGAPAPALQKAAVQALRKMELTDEVQSVLLQAFLETAAPEETRLAAYLLLMRQPSPEALRRVVAALRMEGSEQVRAFVASHLANIVGSEDPGVQGLRKRVEEALQGSPLPPAADSRRLSRNYQLQQTVSLPGASPFSVQAEGNLLLEPRSLLPREAVLKTTLSLFGFHPSDLIEVGLEAQGYEAALEALFGKQGFFPDSASKALYWVDERVPDPVSRVLGDHFGYSKAEKRDQDMVSGLLRNVQRLLEDLGSREAPEAQAYLRVLGQELGYVRLEDVRAWGAALLRTVQSLKGLPQLITETLSRGSQSDLFLHYLFLDASIELPTGAGLPLQLATAGLFVPGLRGGLKLQVADKRAELVARPSLSLELVTHLGISVPDFAWSRVQMNSRLYHEAGLEARAALAKGQLKLAFPAPKRPVKLFQASHSLSLASSATSYKLGQAAARPSWAQCRPLLRGLSSCASLTYPNASALSADASFDLELRPTGEVEDYVASASYELLRGEPGGGLVDQLRLAVQAEGPKPAEEATLTFRYQRSRRELSSDLQVPSLGVDLGSSLRLRDLSDAEQARYSLTLDVQAWKTTEMTLTGHIRCDRKAEGALGVVLSVPFLKAETRSESLVRWAPSELLLQLDSSATAYGTTVSKRVAWRSDDKKMELEWNAGSITDTGTLAAHLPLDVAGYRDRLRRDAWVLLEQKLAHTDMTLSHMGSKLVQALGTWAQKASQGLPYSESLQGTLQGLRQWEMPALQLPDQLFLKSDGRLRYTPNKDHVKVDIPLPFGGKSLEQLKLSRVIRTPALDLQAIGLRWPEREFRLPPLTVPESYPLRVPLLGVLDFSTNIYSNLYNWSASYTGGNTTAAASAPHISLQSRYHVKADAALPLFSYRLQGSGETTYDHKNTLTFSWDGSLHHKLLNSNIKLSHVEKFGNNPASKGFLTFDASSDLGPQASLSVQLESKKKSHVYFKEIKGSGQFTASSFNAKSTYALSYQRDVSTGQITGESNLSLDSSFFQATNQVTGRYEDGSLSVTSASNLQDGAVKNTVSLTLENSQVTLKSDTTGKVSDLSALHKLDVTLTWHNALLRSESQADFRTLKAFSLLSGSLNSRGLELNADLLGTDGSSSGAHKATLRIGQDGLLTSATSSLKILPLMLEHELNAALGPLGSSLKVMTNARYQENNAKFTVDGKLALTEVALGSVYQAAVWGTDSKNVFNFRMNKEGLTLSNDMMGSYQDIKLEHVNSLVIAGLSLDFTSKMENVLSSDKLYQHSFNVQLQPYSLLAAVNHNLKFNALDLANTGKLRLEPLKLSLGGNVKGTYGNGEIKHVYSVTYADLSASYKTDTVGKVGDSELTHRLSANLAGLASSIDINTAYHSESLHFSNIFHAMAEPFKLAVDAHTTGNGRLILLGEHTGQLYSKFLLKAEPLAFTFSHDYKASSGHQLRSRRSLETSLDHKVTALFTPAEQSSSWKLKALANNNGYDHDLQAYNTHERVGVELRAGATVDLAVFDSPMELPYLFSEPVNAIDALDLRTAVAEPQVFSLAGTVKYDKNLDLHVIDLPFLASLPAYFEKARGAVLASLQYLQQYLKSINIDRHVKHFRAALDRLPQLINDQLSKLNLEARVVNVKESLIAFLENSKFTIDDLQNSLDNAKISLNEFSTQFQTNLIQFDQYIKDNYDLHKLKESITKLINHIVEKLKFVDERYQIRVLVMKAVQDVYVFVENLDVNKMGSRAVVWIQKVDSQYQIRAQILEKLQQLSHQIQAVDLQDWANWLKRRIEDIDVRVYLEFFRTSLPIQEIKNIVEHITILVMNLLEDYEVAEKVSVFQAKIHELINKYEVSKQVQVLMDKLVQLANQYKLKETIRGLANSLKKIEIKAHFEKLCLLVDEAIKKIQTVTFGQLIDEVNKFLDLLVKTLQSFDYNQFVDEANKTIRELIHNINEEIRALELPQKVEAAKLYVAEVRAVLSDYLEKIKDTQLTVITDWFWNIMGSNFVVDIRGRFLEVLEDTRDRLYKVDLQKEIQQRLQTLSQVYDTLVNYVHDWWQLIAKEITDFAEQYNISDWAEKLKMLVEHGFTVPEIRTALGTLPAFEVSLRALQEATFQTPDFIIPLTDLRIPSIQINMKKLKEIRVPSKFTTPEFTIFNTFMVPSFTIDLIEIKLKIIRTIDQMMSSEFRWPLPEVSLQDLKVKDTFIAYLTLPDFHFPELTVPEILIPKLSLSEFQVPDLQIPEFQLPHIPHTVVVPTFGKMSGVLKITSPFFTLDASGGIENTTTSKSSPEIVASVTAEGQSTLDFLDFTFQADAHLSAPEMERMDIKESLKFSSKYLKADHESEVLFLATSILGKMDTVATVYTAKNTVELNNSLTLKLQKQVTFESDTKYSHKLNLPQMDFSSQTDLRHELAMLLEAGRVAATSTGKGAWKWAFPRFSDEGTHESQLRFTVEGPMASLGMTNKINSKHVKVNQKLLSESGFLNFAKFELQSEAESQHVGHSALTARGSVLLGELKAELTGTHEAHLNGRVTGTLKNSLSLLAQPFEIGAEMNNEGNIKVSFPLKLTGKIDFLNNYALVLSCDVQQVSWQSGARFNQYRYSQNFSAGNSERSIEAHVSINGEANLDFLNIPLTIPEMTLPYTNVTTPQVKDFSLWERTGLKDFLQTTKQGFDLSVNVQYKKNRDTHAIPFPLRAFYDALCRNIDALRQHVEKGRDKAFSFLTKSYNEAKVQFDKYKVETSLDKLPRSLRVPGYFLPGLNLVVPPFTAEMPAFGYTIPKEISTPGFTIPGIGFSLPSYTLVVPSLEFPVLHVPRSLRKLTLPDIKIPRTSDHLLIPAMGNFTYDFSFKSSVITLNTNMGLYNQSDVVAHFRSSSSSVIDALQYKLDGTTSLTRKRGLKLAMALSLTNRFVEGNHDSTVSLTKRNMEASVTTTARVQCPVLKANFQQELTGTMKPKPTISSSINVKYDFQSARLHSSAKGAIDHKLALESFTSEGFTPYLSIETATQSRLSGSVLSQKYSGSISSEANSYLDPKSTRSSLKLEGTSKMDGIWNIEMKENLAGEASVGHIYTLWEHKGENSLQLRGGFSTNGEQSSKVTLELAPWTASSVIQVHASQPSSLFEKASVSQVVSLTASFKDQKASWKGEGHIQSVSLGHNVQLSNDPAEIRMDVASSLEGQMAFLDDILLPVYDISLWDILKMDVTNYTNKQYLQFSSALVYTKNHSGYRFSIPVKETANEFLIPRPELRSLVTLSSGHAPPSILESASMRLAKKTSIAPFAISLPFLPQVKFPRVDVSTEYSPPEESTLPLLRVTVPEFQVTLSPFTLPKRLPLGGATLDLNEVANKIADFDLPTITMSEQSIRVPALTFWLPTGIFLPSFGALAGELRVASPVYNTTWSARLRKKENQLETTLEATCSSTIQPLEYDLNVKSTGTFEDGVLVGKTRGTFSHRDLSAEYQDDFTYQGFEVLEETMTLSIISPTFTDVHVHYQENQNSSSVTISSPPIGTLGIEEQREDLVLQGKMYYQPKGSAGRKLDVSQAVLSVEGPRLLQLRVSWDEEAVSELAQSLGAAWPRAAKALYGYLDTWHRQQTGLELSRASAKLGRVLAKRADETYAGAMRRLDEADEGLRRAVGSVPAMYQQAGECAKRLYQRADLQELKHKSLGWASSLGQEGHRRAQLLLRSAIELLGERRFWLPGRPGGHTADELGSAVLHRVAAALSRALSGVQQALAALLSSIRDADDEALSRQLGLGSARGSEGFSAKAALLDLGETLQGLCDGVQDGLSWVQTEALSELLESLQVTLAQSFQGFQELLEELQREDLAELKRLFVDGAHLATDWAAMLIQELGEGLQAAGFLVQAQLAAASERLSRLHAATKALWEEHRGPGGSGWALAYYEVEETLLRAARSIVQALLDFQAKTLAGFLGDREPLAWLPWKEVQDALSILLLEEGRGHERLQELCRQAQDGIGAWAAAAKRTAAELHTQLQGAPEQLSQALRWAAERADGLLRLLASGCRAILDSVLSQQRAAGRSLDTYVQVRPGQLTIDVPFPLR